MRYWTWLDMFRWQNRVEILGNNLNKAVEKVKTVELYVHIKKK